MKNIKTIVVLVHDQQKALEVYTGKLGFQVNTDAEFGEGNRWLTVCLPEQTDPEVVLALAKSDEAKSRVGNQLDAGNALLGFITENIEEDIARFKTNDVKLTSELIEQPYGKFIFFEDLYGNRLYLHEEK